MLFVSDIGPSLSAKGLPAGSLMLQSPAKLSQEEFQRMNRHSTLL